MRDFNPFVRKNFFSKKLLFLNLFILQLISRGYIYNIEVSNKSYNFSDNYLEALKNENFFDYLIFFHSRPIINPLLKKISLFFPENIYLFYFVLNSFYTLFFIFLLIDLNLDKSFLFFFSPFKKTKS